MAIATDGDVVAGVAVAVAAADAAAAWSIAKEVNLEGWTTVTGAAAAAAAAVGFVCIGRFPARLKVGGKIVRPRLSATELWSSWGKCEVGPLIVELCADT